MTARGFFCRSLLDGTLVTWTGLAAFCLAHRFRCAAAIFFLASGDNFLLLLTTGEADAGGRPLRFELDEPAITVRAC